MRTIQKLIIKLPFPGFYESLYSGEIDHVEEREIEYRSGDDGTIEGTELEHPEELRLDAGDYADVFMRCTDYSAAYHAVARGYVEAFDMIVSEALDLKLRLEFESMSSPREYNFATDRIFAYVPLSVVRQMFARSKADGHETLGQVVRERCTSYDGFISFYRNDIGDSGVWLAKPVGEWDHNELAILLQAVMRLSKIDDDKDDGLRWRLFDRCAEGEGFYDAWSNAVDWTKFDAEVAELRANKLAELQAADPDYVAPPPRCPDTLDMFTGQPG